MAIITISRGTFSGGENLAEGVAKKLGYHRINREVFGDTARQYGIAEQKLYEAIGETPGVMERLHSEKKQYLAFLRAALMKEVKDDKAVYYGHAGHFLLNGVPHLIRVRVNAKMELRIKALTEHSNLTRQEAVQLIKTLDEKRLRWTKSFYHVDWYNPSLYDVTINLDQVTLADACDIICDTARMRQYQVTPESRKAMEDIALSSHLEAVISSSKSISGAKNVTIRADGGIVTIEGTVESVADADRVRMIVRKTPGVQDINSKMRVRLWGIPMARFGRIGRA